MKFSNFMKVKKKFKIEGMHCASCAMTIEWKLEDIGAVAKCSFAHSEVEVEFDASKISEEEIKKAVLKAGYSTL